MVNTRSGGGKDEESRPNPPKKPTLRELRARSAAAKRPRNHFESTDDKEKAPEEKDKGPDERKKTPE